jgi:DNA-binding LacI/PurR family transcriptional regulator
MRATQQDIARIANVSQATVSRVVSGDERVEPTIRDRVLAVMREQNYQADVRARSLRQKRTGLIGLVLKRPSGGLGSDPFFGTLTAEIMDCLSGRPYHLCLDMVTSEDSEHAVYDEMLRSRRVDGLILVESEARDDRITRLQEDLFPFVLIGNARGEAIFSVDNDNVLAGEMATSHLFSNGYRRVGFIAGPPGLTVSEDRLEGYLNVVRCRGGRPLVWHSAFGPDAARQVAMEALCGDERPDALVVLDDWMAFGVVLAARGLGLHPPRDLGLVGFNDTPLCHLIDGGLSSVSLNIRHIVQTSVRQLLEILDAKGELTPVRHIVPCELRARGSSRPREAQA